MENTRKAKAGTPQYEAVKRHIIATSIDLMAEKGFSKFRFEELAKRVGCVRTTIYRYFDSKQELLREVMLALMYEITNDIIQQTVDAKRVTRKSFTESLFKIITALRTEKRYAVVMDDQNVKYFSELMVEHFTEITSLMLTKYMISGSKGRVLKKGVTLEYAVHWLIHQIISYGFLGLTGETEKEQKDFLNKMVVSVII